MSKEIDTDRSVLETDRRRREALILAAALSVSLLAVAVAEACAAARGQEVGLADLLPLAALAMWSAWIYLVPPVGYAVVVIALELLPAGRRWGRVRIGAHVAAAAAVAAVMYGILVTYAPFSGYPPFITGYVIAAAGLVAHAAIEPRLRGAWRIVLGAALVALGTALHVANYGVHFGRYPTLHLAIIQAVLLAFWMGAAGALRAIASRAALRALGAVSLAAIGLLGVGGATVAASGSEMEPLFVDATVLGQSRTVFNDLAGEGAGGGAALLDTAGRSRFAKFCAMPDLPDDFELEEYNILLIASEATRFDKTSVFDARLRSTPNLARRAGAGVVFRNAFAPSSCTLHSTAGLFAMAYPSMIAMETWMKVWTGQLYDEEETIAESLKGAGYATFWVGYNHWFPGNLLGFQQGFDSVDLVPGNKDDEIGDHAVRALEERARGVKPFFGFVYFVSPHSPYLDHGFKDLPNARKEDRYLQELRFVDVQVERLLDALDRSGKRDKTIVIFLGDHGEEFNEHGGTHHKSTVYSESTRVPLLVWLPGAPSAVVEEPVSTSYVFPWLFSHARGAALRDRFSQRANRVFGPMMRETDGAVVIELLGNKRMKSSLVVDGLKINYDFISKRIEVFRLSSDPGEKKNLFYSDPALKRRATQLVDAYKRVRGAGARYVLKPMKRPPKTPEPEAAQDFSVEL